MRELFDVNGRIFQTLSTIADMVLLNLMFVICSLPVITIGASLTALSGVMLRMKDGEEGYVWKTFLQLFKQKFVKATLFWLAMLLAGGVIGLDLYMYRGQSGAAVTVTRIALFAGAVLWLLLLMTIFPFIARVQAGWKDTLRGAVLLALGNGPKTLLMVLILLAAAAVSLLSTGFLVVTGAFWLLIGCALMAWVNAALQIGMFHKIEENNSI